MAALSPQGLEQVLVRMPPDLHAAIKTRAASEDQTMAQTIREAVRLYLDRPSAAA